MIFNLSVYSEGLEEDAILTDNLYSDVQESMSVEVVLEDTSNNETSDKDVDEFIDNHSASEDFWAETGNLLEGRADCKTIIANGDLYVIGGYGTNGYIYNIDKFNENTLSWETVTTLPKEIKGFSVVSVDDNIYIIGGYINNTYLNDVNIYNTSTNLWTTGIPMTERRDSAAAVYADSKIYIFGGRNARGMVNSYEYYDMLNNTWNKVTSGYDKSLIRIGAEGKYVNGYVCLSGGYNQECENMNISLYKASDLTDMTQIAYTNKEYISIAWGVDKALIFLEDSTKDSGYSSKELTIGEDTIDMQDVYINDYPITTKYAHNVIYNGYLYRFGGYNAYSKSYDTEMYKYSVLYGDFVSGDGQISSTITSGGNTITLNVEAGKKYYFMVNVNNLSTFEGHTFTIEYPEDSFVVTDACIFTDIRDTHTGTVPYSDIKITQIDNKGVSFISLEEVAGDQKVSETVNVIELSAASSGQRTITYRMTK